MIPESAAKKSELHSGADPCSSRRERTSRNANCEEVGPRRHFANYSLAARVCLLHSMPPAKKSRRAWTAWIPWGSTPRKSRKGYSQVQPHAAMPLAKKSRLHQDELGAAEGTSERIAKRYHPHLLECRERKSRDAPRLASIWPMACCEKVAPRNGWQSSLLAMHERKSRSCGVDT